MPGLIQKSFDMIPWNNQGAGVDQGMELKSVWRP